MHRFQSMKPSIVNIICRFFGMPAVMFNRSQEDVNNTTACRLLQIEADTENINEITQALCSTIILLHEILNRRNNL